jgi:hypothetical protein
VVPLGVEAVLAEVEVVAHLTLEPGPRDRRDATTVTGDALVTRRYHLDFGNETQPVLLLGEVDLHVLPVR